MDGLNFHSNVAYEGVNGAVRIFVTEKGESVLF